MVELFAARSRASPRCELLTLARLNEPDGTFTRFIRNEDWKIMYASPPARRVGGRHHPVNGGITVGDITDIAKEAGAQIPVGDLV